MGIRKLLLLRHGQSTWNEEGRWQGIADPPLSTKGEAEAAAVASHLRDYKFVSVFSSDLLRAQQTAEFVASELSLPVKVDENLRERNVGEWSGLTSEEIFERWPEVKERKDKGLPLVEPNEQTEAFADLVYKTIRAYGDVLGDEPVVIVTHGGFIRSLERSIDGKVSDRVPNLSGRWIEFHDDEMRLGDVFLIEGFNSSAALDNVQDSDPVV